MHVQPARHMLNRNQLEPLLADRKALLYLLGLIWEQVHLDGAFIRLTKTKARKESPVG